MMKRIEYTNMNNDKTNIYYFDENGDKQWSVLNYILSEEFYYESDEELYKYLTELLTPEQKKQASIIRGIRTKIMHPKTVPQIRKIVKTGETGFDICKDKVGQDLLNCKNGIRTSIQNKLKTKSITCTTLKCKSAIQNAINKQQNKIMDSSTEGSV